MLVAQYLPCRVLCHVLYLAVVLYHLYHLYHVLYQEVALYLYHVLEGFSLSLSLLSWIVLLFLKDLFQKDSFLEYFSVD